MINLGQFNTLRVVKQVPFGVYLDGDHWGEILLPTKAVPKNTQLHDLLKVFIYFDSEDKIIATTLHPKAQVNAFAFLKVIDVNAVGAFLDWGLEKDLLVPKPEQRRPMELGKSYLVYLKLDNQNRIVASSKLDYYLDQKPADYRAGDEVNLLVAETTELGTKVIINHTHWGLIHKEDIFQPLSYGKILSGYIKAIRPDGKIDVTLRKVGRDNVRDLAKRIFIALDKAGGFLPFHDKSSALEIKNAFNESKKSFKSAIGLLYKQGEIIIESNGIRLKDSQ